MIGEVGLTGEVRPVRHLEQRARELARRGASTAVVPAGQARGIEDLGMRIEPVATLSAAIATLL